MFEAIAQKAISVDAVQNLQFQSAIKNVPFEGFSQFLKEKNIVDIRTPTRALNQYLNYVLDQRVDNLHISVQDAMNNSLLPYETYLNNLVENKQLSRNRRNRILRSIELYYEYLNQSGISKITYLRQDKSIIPVKDYCKSLIFQRYMEELTRRNAPCLNEHYSNISYFLRFLNKLFNLTIDEQLTNLSMDHIRQYESYLARRVALEQIHGSTAYVKLRYLKLYINYMHREKIITFRYEVPSKYHVAANRNNDYVNKNDILSLLNVLFLSKSKNKLRDIAVLLLIIDTGCRPIEITNIRLCDVNTTESTIQLFSKKSNIRTLKINKYPMHFIKEYFALRKISSSKGDKLFTLLNGQELNTKAIGQMINTYNKKAFGEARFSARSLRHTFATNALDNGNELDQVSKSLGHVNWNSTIYYLHQSAKRLLTNTLPFDPIK